jgi:hypothetical protein
MRHHTLDLLFKYAMGMQPHNVLANCSCNNKKQSHDTVPFTSVIFIFINCFEWVNKRCMSMSAFLGNNLRPITGGN